MTFNAVRALAAMAAMASLAQSLPHARAKDPCTIMICTMEYAPVCGSDGKTYGNKCELEAATCKAKDLTKVSDGECPTGTSPQPETKPDCPTACTYEYLPLCGSDGVTYSNKCLFKTAVCKDPSLTKASDGECPTKQPADCDRPCPAILAPVCGSDGKTYDNKCVLETAQCVNPDLKKVSDGECKPAKPACTPTPCPANYMPICGSDGQTYGNECALEAARCENPALKKVGDGECKDGSAAPACNVSPPSDVQYWVGKPYGNAVQIAASWPIAAGAKAYLVCFDAKSPDRSYDTCYNYVQRDRSAIVRWDTGAAAYGKGGEPTISNVRVYTLGGDGCQSTAAAAKKTDGTFSQTCDEETAKADSPIDTVVLNKAKSSDPALTPLDVEVVKSTVGDNINQWEKCTDRKLKSGSIRRYCSAHESKEGQDAFIIHLKNVPNKDTTAIAVDVRAAGSCSAPVVSNTVMV